MPKVMQRLTISQVAREAGVSTQTVSRVLNNRPDVAPETRRRVQEIVKRLGYQPSPLARGLVYQRTWTLGLITAGFDNYFFDQVIASAEVEARAHGYFFMLGSTESNPQDEPEYIRLLTERFVEGILFARPSTEPDARHLLSALTNTVPVVTIAYHIPGVDLTVVDVDNFDGGRQATQCLIELGHRRIATITGPLTWKSAADRLQGYRSALEFAELDADQGLIVEGDWSYQSGYEAIKVLMERRVDFSAIFAQNDQMAIGAIRALHELGRRIPEDVAIVGYDDIPAAAYIDPPLTTMRQPMREIGITATRLLIQAIQDPSSVQGKVVLLKPELVRRRSC